MRQEGHRGLEGRREGFLLSGHNRPLRTLSMQAGGWGPSTRQGGESLKCSQAQPGTDSLWDLTGHFHSLGLVMSVDQGQNILCTVP